MTAQLATLKTAQTAPALTGARQIGLTPQSIDDALRMAEIMSKASIVPKDYQGNPGNILVAIQWGAEIGLPPLQAMQNLAVINGRPAIWGDAVIALVRGSGLLETIHEDITADVATCTVKRKGEPPASRSFSVEDAKRAGLWGKAGPWQQYPKRMLQMRARAWALRDVFPDVLRGVHVAEEAQDMPDERAMGHAEIVPEPTPTQSPTSRTEALKARLRPQAPIAAPVMADGLPVQPAPDLPAVLTLIRQADTLHALEEAGTLAAALGTDKEKSEARKAYKARMTALKSEATRQPEPAPDLELTPPTGDQAMIASLLRAIRASKSAEDLAECRDLARDVEVSAAQAEEIARLMAEAEQRVGE